MTELERFERSELKLEEIVVVRWITSFCSILRVAVQSNFSTEERQYIRTFISNL